MDILSKKWKLIDYSITKGFLNNIPPEVIGSIYNLEMLYHKNNIRKTRNVPYQKKNY